MSDILQIIASVLASIVALVPSSSASVSFVPPPPELIPHATVLFGGDMMFDRSIRSTMKEKGGDFIFSCIDTTLRKADLVVANLEGPITNEASKSVGTAPGAAGNYTFTFPTSTAQLLFSYNIRMVNLGNNHIWNFGASGVRSTIEFLEKAGVEYFGNPLDSNMATKDIHGVLLTFINYNEFGGSATTTIEQIQEARIQGRLPIVYTHWGVEYATTSPEYIRTIARAFIDSGAEIVIGSHPHVVEEREFYREKYIYYSLGNLFFDQYWNSDVRRGLMLNVDFDSSGVRYVEEVTVELQRDRRTCPLNNA